MANPSSLCCPPSTRFAILNLDGSPANEDFHIQADQVVGLPDLSQVQLKSQSVQYLPQITGLTGGGSTKLDGIATASLPTKYAVLIRVAGQGLGIWVLELDTDPVDGAQVVTPASHTTRSWRQRQ